MTARTSRKRAAARLLPLACLLATAGLPVHADPARLADVAARFAAPPDDARPMVRWWWFGPAVVKPQLEREMLAMKAGGFGGFEIQPVYPMELDDPARGIRNVPYLSADFLDAVRFVNDKAHQHGLLVDMTLASGWPYGGPHVSAQEAAGRVRQHVAALPAGATSVALPSIMSGEKLLGTFVGAGDVKSFDASRLRQAAVTELAGRMAVAPANEDRVAVFYVASRTGQQVKRAALGAEGFVLDHLSRKALDDHLQAVAEPLLQAFGDRPPHAVFSDSLEVYNTDWTDDLLAEFKRRRGYDLLPHLPAAFTGQGKDAAALRHDWALTQTELVNERYLTPLNDWARKHGTRFRSQTYGQPVVTMSSNRLVDLPEGEGPQFRAFSFTRWATSAGHLYGKNVISAETWTWLNSPAFAASPLDMKVEADRMLLQGVNQFVGHGWPYTPPGAREPGYSFYAAAVFNDHQPWWNVLPDVNAYLTRASWLLRQGEPANDVAVLLPVDDAYASMGPGKMSVSEKMDHYVTEALTTQILDAGHNLDYVDPESVLALGVKHPVLVLPHVTRLAPEVLEKLQAYARGGGKIVTVGSKPSLAPGHADAEKVTQRVTRAAQALFALPGVQFVANDADVGAALARAVPADFQVQGQAGDVGFIRRKLPDADIYFIANTSNRPVDTTAVLRAPRKHAAWWSPMDGSAVAASVTPALPLRLAPYESRVLVLSDAPQSAAPAVSCGPATVLADLSRDWQVAFPGQAPRRFAELRSWTDDPATRFVSAEVTYTKDVEVSALADSRVLLDFGAGKPMASAPKVPAGMRAMLEPPVREAAIVFVNGQRAGSLWSPPYRVDVTKLLQPGRNRIEVKVANLALNMLAGQERPDYRLLWARYGQRFVPQDTQLIAPQPSGLLGPVQLLAEPAGDKQ
ncbi:alpha-L-rhamnosidase-like protein [Pseudoduganella flava]|uniref:Alpha-L-rhamnosidase-like protein n=1 Tax=Pseudoduganella flava TaxID=871742 RepID=A0A562Q5K7_9BURK|nr:glycosyl hydrolase [Pseudoduganella flava]QGZ41496.1 glycoside hydrolase [Pseudoduganella flava]TWI51460.1 alpha-L-rhamnosidase-like protein [Pseudoduganella flava]